MNSNGLGFGGCLFVSFLGLSVLVFVGTVSLWWAFALPVLLLLAFINGIEREEK